MLVETECSKDKLRLKYLISHTTSLLTHTYYTVKGLFANKNRLQENIKVGSIVFAGGKRYEKPRGHGRFTLPQLYR